MGEGLISNSYSNVVPYAASFTPDVFNCANFIAAAGTGGGAMRGPDRTYFLKPTYQAREDKQTG